ncbi:response regulator transcription factor [Streptomyces sp. NPDC053750]|uniref:response regulator transcription factor n=1 Tax=Streptomyces sp. NPDC053750 TaxID=3365714 RepID=UPI0037D78885
MSATLVRRALRQTQPAPADVRPWGPPGALLTPRELEVLHLVAEGLSNKQAARRLQISEHGVKRLVGNVLARLNCPNRTLAVVRAMEDGLLSGVGQTAGAREQSTTHVA